MINLKKIILTLTAILFLLFVYLSYNLFVPVKSFPVETVFSVEREESGAQIFARLQKEGYIESIFWAKVSAKILRTNKFYRGDFAFDKPCSVYEVVKIISTRPVSLAVLIPEGFTKSQVADRLAKYIVRFNRSDFLKKAKEGYLFPDTYYFYSYSTNDEILAEFNRKFNQEMLKNFQKLPTEKEIIIASMIEREVRDPEDMKIVSGIIQNRLKINMPLQIDATVLYGQGAWKNRVYYSDLKHQSDYNTYQITGLPIGPISNPGINAIKAAMYPTKTKYFYYLTGKDGKFYYAVTHEEHVANKSKYLR